MRSSSEGDKKMIKEKKNILQIYGIFLLAVILNFVPSAIISSFGSLLLLIIIVATYIYRAKSNSESLCYNHMCYLIKSFWISSLLLLIGIILTYLLGDHSIINNTVDGVVQGVMFTPDQLEIILMNYTKQNILVLLLTLSPSIIYLGYRVVKGMILANKEQKISNLKSWI